MAQISAGTNFSLFVDDFGSAWSWGYNNLGKLGDWTTTNRSSPVSITMPLPVVRLSAGVAHGLALDGSGNGWGWGFNNSGRLGNNSITNESSPVAVVGNHSFTQISAGLHSLGLKEDGTTWSWGLNSSGQLGIQSTSARSSPVSVVGNHSFIQVAAGYDFSLGLKADGSVWAWGSNTNGKLGDQTTTSKSSPVLVVGNHSFVEIAAGYMQSIARKADGSVWSWGYNSALGYLADGTSVSRSSPVAVIGNHSFIQISANGLSSPSGYIFAGLKEDGSVWTWGSNDYGQLGIGVTSASRSSPVAVIGAHSFVQISVGADHMLALKANREVWGWGRNFFGELGDNTTTGKASPVMVLGAWPSLSVIAPSGIASEEAFGTPELIKVKVIAPSGINSEESFGTPEIANVTPAGGTYRVDSTLNYVVIHDKAVERLFRMTNGSILALRSGGVSPGISRSTDGGLTWTIINGVETFSAITQTKYAPNAGTLWAFNGTKIKSSTDGGVTWTEEWDLYWLDYPEKVILYEDDHFKGWPSIIPLRKSKILLGFQPEIVTLADGGWRKLLNATVSGDQTNPDAEGDGTILAVAWRSYFNYGVGTPPHLAAFSLYDSNMKQLTTGDVVIDPTVEATTADNHRVSLSRDDDHVMPAYLSGNDVYARRYLKDGRLLSVIETLNDQDVADVDEAFDLSLQSDGTPVFTYIRKVDESVVVKHATLDYSGDWELVNHGQTLSTNPPGNLVRGWCSEAGTMFISDDGEIVAPTYATEGIFWDIVWDLDYPFTGIWFDSTGEHIFAVGNAGFFVRYDADVSEPFWYSIPTGTDLNLTAVWGVSTTEIYVVGTNASGTSKTFLYDGATFTELPPALAANVYALYGFETSGGPCLFTAGNRIYRHVPGASPFWELLSSSTDIINTWGSSPSDVYFVGSQILHWDGTLLTQLLPGQMLHDLSFVNVDDPDSTKLSLASADCVWGTAEDDVFIGCGLTYTYDDGNRTFEVILHWGGTGYWDVLYAYLLPKPESPAPQERRKFLAACGFEDDVFFTIDGLAQVLHLDRTQLATATNFRAANKALIFAEGYNSIAMTDHPRAYGWGRDGLVDLEGISQYLPMLLNPWWDDVERVSIGKYAVNHATAVKDVGTQATVWVWGDNTYGQLGTGDTTDRDEPFEIDATSGMTGIVDVSCGWLFTMFLDVEGNVWSCGSNYFGELGLGLTVDIDEKVTLPTKIDLENVVKISAGKWHALALTSDGSVYSWGRNNVGALGRNDLLDTVKAAGVLSAACSSDGAKLVGYENGSPGDLSTSTNYGVAWTSRMSSSFRMDVASSSDGADLIAGKNNIYGAPGTGRLWTSIDSGINWTERRPLGDTSRQWTCVGSNSDASVLLAGTYDTDQLFVSTDGGLNWNDISPAAKHWWRVALSTDGSKIIAASSTRLYTSTNTGGSWTERQPAGNVDKWWRAVASSSDGRILVAATFQRVFMSFDYGVNWIERQPAGDVNKSWNCAAMNADGSIVAVGIGSPNFGSTSGQLYYSIDFGESWEGFDAIDRPWETVCFSADGSKMFAGYYGIPTGGSSNQISTANVPGLMTTGAIDVAAGYDHSVVLKEDGGVWACGWNRKGEIGDGTFTERDLLVPVSGISGPTEGTEPPAIRVFAGEDLSAALLDDGTVRTWGAGENGQLGNGSLADSPYPVTPNTGTQDFDGVVDLSLGIRHFLALRDDATVWGWGANYDNYSSKPAGQVGSGDFDDQPRPILVDNSLWTSPFIWDEMAFDPTESGIDFSSVIVGELNKVTACGQETIFGGSNQWKTVNADPCSTDPNFRGSVQDGDAIRWFTGGDDQYAWSPAPVIKTWLSKPWADVARMTIGFNYVTALTDSLYVWGNNTNGELGLGDTSDRHVPTVSPFTEALDVAAGNSHNAYVGTVAVKSGDVWACGNNTAGTLGPGLPAGNVTSLTKLNPQPGITALVARGNRHTMALLGDGTVVCWGENSYGQLGGTPDANGYAHPTLTNVVAIGAGYYCSFALRSDGTLWSWGRNDDGQLGLGDLVNRSVPTRITSLSGVSSFTICDRHCVAITDLKAFYVWGYNVSGQLGLGDVITRNAPVLLNLANASAAAVGIDHSLFLNDEGLWASGSNYYGQLGVGNLTASTTEPKLVMASFYDITSIAAGGYNSAAINRYGMKVWGRNDDGEIGNDTTDSPVYEPTSTYELEIPGSLVTFTVPNVVYGIYVFSPTDVFAVGRDGMVLRYDGNVWNVLAVPTQQWLTGVYGNSPTDVFVCGYFGTMLYFNGATWALESTGTTNHLRWISGIHNGQIYCVGDNGTILRLTPRLDMSTEVQIGGTPSTISSRVSLDHHDSSFGAAVWQEGSDVYAQRFGSGETTLGVPIAVDTGSDPAVATIGSAYFAVAYVSTTDELKIKFYDSSGALLTTVTASTGTCSQPSIAEIGAGTTTVGYVVSWMESVGKVTSAQYASDGSVVHPSIRLSTASQNAHPAAAWLFGDEPVVAYQSNDGYADKPLDVVGARFVEAIDEVDFVATPDADLLIGNGSTGPVMEIFDFHGPNRLAYLSNSDLTAVSMARNKNTGVVLVLVNDASTGKPAVYRYIDGVGFTYVATINVVGGATSIYSAANRYNQWGVIVDRKSVYVATNNYTTFVHVFTAPDDRLLSLNMIDTP